VEVDRNPFLASPLLKASVHEEELAINVVSRTPSSPAVRKKDKKGKKVKILIFYL
jgi:hypothetical protein